MPEKVIKVIHEIRLNQYSPQYAGGNRLSLGTSHSYGIERLHLILDEGWDGLAVTATFHSPEGLPVRMLMDTDGMVDVPPEATASAGLGKIVISGAADGVRRISCNLPYTVMEHAHTFGGTSTGPTPDVISQILASTLEDRKAAATSSAQAEAQKTAAAKSASDAQGYMQTASGAATAANASAKNAEASAASAANAAKKAADESVAANIAVIEKMQADVASKQTAAKTSEDAAAKSAADADSTANSINNSMMQIAANKEAVSQLKEDLSQLSDEIENIDVSGCGSTTEYIEGDYKLNTLFDLDFAWFDGIRINSDGSELSNSSYTTTDYIPITPDMKIDDFYSEVYQNSFAFYDKKKNFIAFAESIPEKAAYMRYHTQITTLQITVDGFESRGTFKFWRQFPTDQTDRNLGIPAKKSLMDTIYNPLIASATINFYGDSNTYGYNVDQKSWAYYIAKRLKDTFSGTKLYYYGGSPYVQAWGMNTSSSLATLCLKSLSGSTISDASPFVKFKTNAEKAYCGWVSTSNSATYAILVDGVVQESGSVTSAGAYETEITLDGDFHTIMIKPYGNSTINNPYFAIEKQISFNNYGKPGATSQTLPVSGLDTCDYAIVLIGTNDGNNSVYTGVQNGVTFLKFGDHADKCVFIEPPFRCDGKENSHILCNNHISQICDLMGIRHLRLDSLAAIFGLQYAVLMQSDGLHYSTQGHITIANAVSAAMGFATNYKTDYADTDTIGNIFDNLAQ